MKKGMVWLVVLFTLTAGLLLSLNSAQASGVCEKYKEHKRKFKTEENKEIYFKIKWLQDKQNATYIFYKTICEPYGKNYLGIGKYETICHDYYIHEEYEDYQYYKKQCHKHNDNDDEVIITPTPPAPDPEQLPT